MWGSQLCIPTCITMEGKTTKGKLCLQEGSRDLQRQLPEVGEAPFVSLKLEINPCAKSILHPKLSSHLAEAILGTSRGVSHECPPEKPHPNTSRTSLSLPASTEAHLSPGPAAQRETLVQLWSNSQELTQCIFSKPIDPKAHGGRSIWRAGKLQHVLGRLQASMLAAKDHFRRLFLCVI